MVQKRPHNETSRSVVLKLIRILGRRQFDGTLYYQGDHSPDTLKFPDNCLAMCGTHANVKWYS